MYRNVAVTGAGNREELNGLVRRVVYSGIGGLKYHGMGGMLYKKTESRKMLRKPRLES